MKSYTIRGKTFASLRVVLTPEMAKFAGAHGMSPSQFIEHLLRKEYRRYNEE